MATDTLGRLVALSRQHPGLPVTIITTPDGLAEVSVLNLYPTSEDYFFEPIPLSRFKDSPEMVEVALDPLVLVRAQVSQPTNPTASTKSPTETRPSRKTLKPRSKKEKSG